MTDAINSTNTGFPYAQTGAALGAIAGGVTGYRKKAYLEDGNLSDIFINSVKQTMPGKAREVFEKKVSENLREIIKENRYYAEKIPTQAALGEFVQKIHREYTPQGVFEKLKKEIAARAEKCKKNILFFNKLNPSEQQFIERFNAASSIDETYELVQSLGKNEMRSLGRKLGKSFKILCIPSCDVLAQELTNIGLLDFNNFINNEVKLMDKLFKGVKTPLETNMLRKIDINNPVNFAEVIVNDFFQITDNVRSKIISSYYNPGTKTFENTSDAVGSYIKSSANKGQLRNTLTYGVIGAAVLCAVGYLLGDYINSDKSKTQAPVKKV